MSKAPDRPTKNIFNEALISPPGMPSNDFPESGPEQAPEQNAALVRKKRHSASIFVYLLILFAAAFLMLLMAYFVQRRNNDAMLLDMQAALPNVELAKQLRIENQQLKEENEMLQQQVEQLEQAQKELDQALADAQFEVSKTDYQRTMLAASWQVEIKFQEERYADCAAEMKNLFASYQNGSPPDMSFIDISRETDTVGSFNTYERLTYIRDELIALGYLEEGEVIIEEKPYIPDNQ